jgi:hypothetical protein
MPDEDRLVDAFGVEDSHDVRRQIRTGVGAGRGVRPAVTALIKARDTPAFFELRPKALPDVQRVNEAV